MLFYLQLSRRRKPVAGDKSSANVPIAFSLLCTFLNLIISVWLFSTYSCFSLILDFSWTYSRFLLILNFSRTYYLLGHRT